MIKTFSSAFSLLRHNFQRLFRLVDLVVFCVGGVFSSTMFSGSINWSAYITFLTLLWPITWYLSLNQVTTNYRSPLFSLCLYLFLGGEWRQEKERTFSQFRNKRKEGSTRRRKTVTLVSQHLSEKYND